MRGNRAVLRRYFGNKCFDTVPRLHGRYVAVLRVFYDKTLFHPCFHRVFAGSGRMEKQYGFYMGFLQKWGKKMGYFPKKWVFMVDKK
jgi:hypothetical protein